MRDAPEHDPGGILFRLAWEGGAEWNGHLPHFDGPQPPPTIPHWMLLEGLRFMGCSKPAWTEIELRWKSPYDRLDVERLAFTAVVDFEVPSVSIYRGFWAAKGAAVVALQGGDAWSVVREAFTKARYRIYLTSDRWRQKRSVRLRMDGFRCVRCDSARRLEVHHLNYDRLGDEDVDRDLITLCRRCHAAVEDRQIER